MLPWVAYIISLCVLLLCRLMVRSVNRSICTCLPPWRCLWYYGSLPILSTHASSTIYLPINLYMLVYLFVQFSYIFLFFPMDSRRKERIRKEKKTNIKALQWNTIQYNQLKRLLLFTGFVWKQKVLVEGIACLPSSCFIHLLRHGSNYSLPAFLLSIHLPDNLLRTSRILGKTWLSPIHSYFTVWSSLISFVVLPIIL